MKVRPVEWFALRHRADESPAWPGETRDLLACGVGMMKVLEDGIREDDIEARVGERKSVGVRQQIGVRGIDIDADVAKPELRGDLRLFTASASEIQQIETCETLLAESREECSGVAIELRAEPPRCRLADFDTLEAAIRPGGLDDNAALDRDRAPRAQIDRPQSTGRPAALKAVAAIGREAQRPSAVRADKPILVPVLAGRIRPEAR